MLRDETDHYRPSEAKTASAVHRQGSYPLIGNHCYECGRYTKLCFATDGTGVVVVPAPPKSSIGVPFILSPEVKEK